ncbi:unnamed protein product [Lactuca virosa]|uniref:Uncharacterized protein n=1 Tax=Lactuca virosa TaxID=75947 RepID=A0AAU9PKQ2_9ASTR|nr:unnamed protein product [Lactuca virosa]
MEMVMRILMYVKYVSNHQLQLCFFLAAILACVNLVQLRVPSVQFAVPRLLIEFLLSHLDICILPPSPPSKICDNIHPHPHPHLLPGYILCCLVGVIL